MSPLLRATGNASSAKPERLLAHTGWRAFGISADVAKKGDVDAAISNIARTFDGVDILISNAGTGTSETIMDAPDEKWQYFLGLACNGRNQMRARSGASHEKARRRSHPELCLPLRKAAYEL